MESCGFLNCPAATISGIITNTIQSGVGAISTMMSASTNIAEKASLLLIIYVGLRIILGYGDIRETLSSFFKIMFVILLIRTSPYALDQFIYPAIKGIREFFSGNLGKIHEPTESTGVSIYQQIDLMLAKGRQLSLTAWDNVSGYPSTWIYLVYAILILILSTLVAVIFTFIALGAEIILILLVTIGPFYIIFFLYASTRGYFFQWINTVFANLILLAISVFFINFSITIMDKLNDTFPMFSKTDYPSQQDSSNANNAAIESIKLGAIGGEYDYSDNSTSIDEAVRKNSEYMEKIKKQDSTNQAGFIGLLFYYLLILKLSFEIPSIAQSLSGGAGAGASAAALAQSGISSVKSAVAGAIAGSLAWVGSKFKEDPPPPPPSPVEQLLQSVNQSMDKQTAALTALTERMDPRIEHYMGENDESEGGNLETPSIFTHGGINEKETSEKEIETENNITDQESSPHPEPAATPPQPSQLAEEKGQGATEAEAGKAGGNDSNKIDSPEKADVNVNTHVDADVIAKGGRNSGGDGGSPNNGLPSNAAHGASGIGGAIDSAQRESAQQQSQTGSNTQPSTPATSGGSGSKGTPSASNSTTPPAPQNEKKPSITDPKGNKPPKEPPIKKL